MVVARNEPPASGVRGLSAVLRARDWAAVLLLYLFCLVSGLYGAARRQGVLAWWLAE